MEVVGGSRFILPDALRDVCLSHTWMQPHFMDDEGSLIMSIHALVVDTGERRIVVDTCLGNDKEREIPAWSMLQTSFIDDLTVAGYPPESIDTVMCTHLHVDHVGWNTRFVDGEWVPTFTNANYLMARPEWEYWSSNGGDQTYGSLFADSIQPVVDADLQQLVETDHRLCDEVSLIPTIGHTPGHVSVMIESEGHRAMITGDCFHHPVQMSRPDWCSSADHDQARGEATRRELLDRLSGQDSDIFVIGTHFATPTAGYVRRFDDGSHWLDVG
ncbi:MAG: MBL fold metallo-hydrolase [Actinomycetia bacterium]|nr:MBL fold metallo-hydrolase [Actinomycetes bacterium]